MRDSIHGMIYAIDSMLPDGIALASEHLRDGISLVYWTDEWQIRTPILTGATRKETRAWLEGYLAALLMSGTN